MDEINAKLIEIKDTCQFYDVISNIWALEQNVNNEESDIFSIERRVLFHFYDHLTGELKTNGQLQNKYDEPLCSDLNHNELEYLKTRLTTLSSNALVHGFYSHVIWKYSHHRDFALLAIRDYLKIIRTKNYKLSTYLDLVHSIAFLSKETKLLYDDVKNEICNLLNGDYISVWAKCSIISSLYESKFFKSEDLSAYLEVSKAWVKEIDNSYSHNEKLLLTMIKVSQSLNYDNKSYFKLLAENEDYIIEQHEGDFILPQYLFKKASYYKKGGFEQEFRDTMILYNQAKTKMRFSNIKQELDEDQSKPINDYIKNCVEEILSIKDPIEILQYIGVYIQWFPSNSDLEIMTKKLNMNSIRQFATVVYFDINGNPTIQNKDRKEKEHTTTSFTFYYTIMCQSVVMKVLIKAIEEKLFSFDYLIEYLNNTWLHKRYTIANRKEHENESWINIMKPGLKELCDQFILASKSDSFHKCNFILCIDSLVPKLEGAIRDLIRLLGGNTTIEKNNEVLEKTLEQLLNEECLLKILDGKEITFFKYVLTRDGLNIRNNIAHGFTFSTNYTYQMAINIFLCIIKLASIDISWDTFFENE
jgi:hypothetical protein